MKPVLIVDGKELEVINIYYSQGIVQTVQANLGDNEYKTYSDKKYLFSHGTDEVIDMDKCLKWVGVYDELIAKLDEITHEETKELTAIAIEAFEEKDNLPFNTNLTDAHKEYHMKRERLMGVVDTVESVKAYSEGYYDKVGDE